MIRVAIVDDSATMRALIRHVLAADSGIAVVGEAADPHEARQLIKSLNPDVITLDVDMPGMDGLDFLERIMRLRPMPVVMVSSLTGLGAEASLQALELGAVECVAKPRPGDAANFARLPQILRGAATARVRGRVSTRRSAAPPAGFIPDGRLVAIGASTGGVEALLSIVAQFPANCPPTVIVQHMPETFTGSFARRLDRSCAAEVTEARTGAPILPGRVYLAPGGHTHLAVAGSGPWFCRLTGEDPAHGHRPSVDVLFASIAKAAGARAMGVILTGMGRDGATGLLAMRQAGARTLGQDEASAVVYGMPKVAFELDAVERQLPLGSIAAEILAACNANRRERP